MALHVQYRLMQDPIERKRLNILKILADAERPLSGLTDYSGANELADRAQSLL